MYVIEAIKLAKSTDREAVLAAMGEVEYNSPCGLMKGSPDNAIFKNAFIVDFTDAGPVKSVINVLDLG